MALIVKTFYREEQSPVCLFPPPLLLIHVSPFLVSPGFYVRAEHRSRAQVDNSAFYALHIVVLAVDSFKVQCSA